VVVVAVTVVTRAVGGIERKRPLPRIQLHLSLIVTAVVARSS
jgi:hypothetical protein